MRSLFLSLLALFTLTTYARVNYFASGDTIRLANVCAMEVRAESPSVKPGELLEWSVNWLGAQITLQLDARNALDELLDPAVRLIAMGQTATTNKINSRGGIITIGVEWDAKATHANVYVGNKARHLVLTLDSLPRPEGPLTVSGNAKPIDLMVRTTDCPAPPVLVPSTAGLAAWSLLDYESGKTNLLLGGEYKLALLPTADGYELIYLSGASTCASLWQPGMRKGRLVKSGFENYYRLEWLTATGASLYGRHYATLDPAQGLLTLQFPQYKTSVRFASSPQN